MSDPKDILAEIMDQDEYKPKRENAVIKIQIQDKYGQVYGVTETLVGAVADYDPRDVSERVEEKLLVLLQEILYGTRDPDEDKEEREVDNEQTIKDYEQKE